MGTGNSSLAASETPNSSSKPKHTTKSHHQPHVNKKQWFEGFWRGSTVHHSKDAATKKKTIIPAKSDKDDDEEEESEVTVLHDLIAGGVAGSASVVVGHPFDTIKVRLQTAAAGSSSSLTSVATSFGGISSLFRGMGAPLVSASAVNAIIFSAYGTSSRYWDEYVDKKQEAESSLPKNSSLQEATSPDREAHDSWQKAFVCGSFAGFIQAFVICPTEHVKCRLQIQHGKGAKDNVFKGPVDAAVSILRKHGISGLYRGWVVTAWREVPAFGLYFSVYDFCKDMISEKLAANAGLDLENDDVPHSHLWISSALSGGFSGSLTWAVIYPADVIKSRIQTAPLDASLTERRIITVGRQLVQKHGWRFLFRGLGITLIRAFPVNGIIFPVYEFTLLHLTGELNGDDDI